MNEEQYYLLTEQGVEAWNAWRQEHLGVGIDLREADLSYANLSYANLIGANLNNANLSNAHMSYVRLIEADLIEADLSYAFLYEAQLRYADLDLADLRYANLRKADFFKADLNLADLRYADLIDSCLVAARLLESNLSGSKLTGACIQDWNINSDTNLESVVCEYVYLKLDSNEQKIDRRPRDPNKIFEPGEFTQLFQKVANAVELVFRNGVDWAALSYAFNEENLRVESETGDKLKMRECKLLDGGLVAITVEAPPNADIDRIHQDLSEERITRLRLEGKVEGLQGVVDNLLMMLPNSRTIVEGDQYNNYMSKADIGNVANKMQDHAQQQNTQDG